MYAAAIHVCVVRTPALLRLSGFQRNLNSSAATLLLSLEVDLPPGVGLGGYSVLDQGMKRAICTFDTIAILFNTAYTHVYVHA